MLRIAIVIPVKNEEASITQVLGDVENYCNYTIVVVNDDSSDDTGEIAKRNGAIVLNHVINLGAWRATQTGIRYARKYGYDAVITLDGDGQHCASNIPLLVEKYEQGYDLVVGSCMSRGSKGRHIAWNIFKKLSGVKINDLTSGFRIYSRDAMDALSSRQATMLEYQDVGVLLMLRHLRLSQTEIQVTMKKRENGISRIFHSWKAVIIYLMYTFILSVTKSVPISSKRYKTSLMKGNQIE